jgi:hypothetical protein
MEDSKKVEKSSEIVEVKAIGTSGINKVTIKRKSDWQRITYKELNGTYFNDKTPDSIITVLDALITSGARCRIFFGDAETGYDWAESHNTIGTIDISTGSITIPVLITSNRIGGKISFSDQYIVKIVESSGGRVLWIHPNYQKPEFSISNRGDADFPHELPAEYVSSVIRTNGNAIFTNPVNFRSRKHAERYVEFLTGQRNRREYRL